jgi:bacillithiol biosynthesis cysteine-adding enzyme BshC
MRCRAIAYSRLPHPSKLFLDYIEKFPRVAPFYSGPPKLSSIVRAARSLKFPAERRAAVAAILREQNDAFGAGALTRQNLARFERGALGVVTGQQVGLFSGPAYALYKAVTAAAIAEELSRAGVAAVPVFWLATEDHDLDEVRSAHWFAQGELLALGLEAGNDAGRPVGQISLGAEMEEALRRAIALLEGPDAQRIASYLEASYGSGETYGSAFGKLFARLFEQDGLILLDPLAPQFHKLAAPVYRRAVEESAVLREKLLARNRELDRAGYAAQVKVTARSTLLFSLEGGRREAITENGGNFLVGARAVSREELLRMAEESPEKLSANALLRPVVQDFLLPTAAYIGGPAEIAYYAQTAVLYEHLLGRAPRLLPRAGFTMVDGKARKLLERYGMAVEDIWAGKQSLQHRMEAQFVPGALAKDFGRSLKEVEEAFARLRRPIRRLDPTLDGSVERARRAVTFHLSKLQRKAGRARELRDHVLAKQEEYLLGLLYPKKQLQSRVLCGVPFLARWGVDLLSELKRRAGSKRLGAHQIVELD